MDHLALRRHEADLRHRPPARRAGGVEGKVPQQRVAAVLADFVEFEVILDRGGTVGRDTDAIFGHRTLQPCFVDRAVRGKLLSLRPGRNYGRRKRRPGWLFRLERGDFVGGEVAKLDRLGNAVPEVARDIGRAEWRIRSEPRSDAVGPWFAWLAVGDPGAARHDAIGQRRQEGVRHAWAPGWSLG